MAHHSEVPRSASSDALFRELFAEKERLGPTGAFPQGRLTSEDEGEIRMGITVHNGKVVMDFGKPTAWVGMDPQQARDLAATLIRRANEADRAEG